MLPGRYRGPSQRPGVASSTAGWITGHCRRECHASGGCSLHGRLAGWNWTLPLPDFTIRRAWKGYLFEVLDVLEEEGYISQTRRAGTGHPRGVAAGGSLLPNPAHLGAAGTAAPDGSHHRHHRWWGHTGRRAEHTAARAYNRLWCRAGPLRILLVVGPASLGRPGRA